MQPPHSGHALALKVLEFLKDWGIERKVFTITLDNASSNDNMQNILREHLCLSNSLLLNGKYFHIRCSAHILNRIVQDGLEIASGALHKIRQSVHYVKVTESRKRQFFQCVEQVGGIDTSVCLKPDCVTRWNSTYIMLETAIKYRRAFHSLSLVDKNYKWCPSNDEWEKGISMCEFLRPFYTITNLISGSTYPTSNLYFGEIWRIELLLTSNLTNEDLLIQEMCHVMKEKFDKYWSEYSVILAFGAILDPTKMLNFLKYTYSKLDPCGFENKLEKVKKALYALFEEYDSKKISTSTSHWSSNVNQLSTFAGGGKGREKLPTLYYDDFEEFDCLETNNAGKSQLDIYLEEPRITISGNFDVLGYWRDRSNRFGDLTRMARDILSIPITTVASEIAFSIGSRVLNKYRSSLLDETVQSLICTRSWLLGFEDDDEEETIEDVHLSNVDSNVTLDNEDGEEEE